MRVKPRPLIIGHRGNPGNPLNSHRVENTTLSFENAFKCDADGIELDVHLTKDGVLVVHHDDNLGRVFVKEGDDNTRLISDYQCNELTGETSTKLNEEEIRKARNQTQTDFGYIVGEDRIPALCDIEIPAGKKLFLELKFPKDLEPQFEKDPEGTKKGSEYLDRLVRETVKYLESAHLIDRTYILSFVPSALDRVKDCNHRLLTAYNIYQNETRRFDFESLLKALKRGYEFDIVNPPFDQTTDETIKVIHHLGLKTFPWTWHENAEQELKEAIRLLNAGVDGIITNQPDKARRL